MKGLSAIISVVLLLMICISISGLVFVWVGRTTAEAENSTGAQMESVQESISKCVTLDSASGNKIYLRNCGNGVISNNTLSIFVDNVAVNYSLSGNISPFSVGVATISGGSFPQGLHELKITGVGQSIEEPASVCTVNCSSTVKTGLVSFWKFEEGYGLSINDSSGKGNVGTFYGEIFNNGNISGATRIAGKYGTALNFSGVSDRVVVPDNDTLDFGTGPFTVLLWAKTTYKRSNMITKGSDFNSNAGWSLSYASSPQRLYAIVANGTTYINYNTGYGNITDWVFLGIMRDSSNNVYFINNGTIIDTGYDMVGSVSNSANLTFGGGSYYFNGSIDSIRIWNRTLNSTEILAEKDSSRPANGRGMVGNWEFEEGSGTVVRDSHNYVAGRYGTAVQFDGKNDYVLRSPYLNYLSNASWTADYWLKWDGYGNNSAYTFFDGSGGTSGNVMVRVLSNSRLAFRTYGTSSYNYFTANSTDAYFRTGWFHVAFVANGSGYMTAYINGNSIGGLQTASGTDMQFYLLGRGYSCCEYNFNGAVDQVRIYNRSLTQSEIIDDMNE